MTSPLTAIDAIFSRPREAAAILFLIESSCYVAPLWQRLRESYIPSFFNAIKGANPSAVVEALWMPATERAPFKLTFDPSTPQTPRWDDIPAINFGPRAGNTISPANVSRAVEALSETFDRGPATRHLVVVAALDPSADALGPRATLAWPTVVERMDQEDIRLHLIVRSQSVMEGLTALYWELIDKCHAYQSLTDDTQFAFYLSDYHDKGKAPVVDDRRVPNSGSHLTATTSDGSPVSSIDKRSLVYQLQKLNGVEKKRRSRTRRDQIAANKPGQPYQKGSPHAQTISLTAQPTSPGPSGRSPPRRKNPPCVSITEAPSSHLNPLPPRTPSHEYGVPSTTSPFWSPSLSSPYYPSAGISPSSPGLRNLSPFPGSSPIPTSTFDHFQHMASTMQSTPDPLSPSSPGYRELQGYNYRLTGDVVSRHPMSQTFLVDRSRPVTTQFDDIHGPNHSYWNELDRQQGQITTSYPPAPNGSVPRLARQPERTTTTALLPPMSRGLGTPVAEHPGGGYLSSGYKDRATGTYIYPLPDHL